MRTPLIYLDEPCFVVFGGTCTTTEHKTADIGTGLYHTPSVQADMSFVQLNFNMMTVNH